MTERTTRGLRIATRCTSIDQFVAAFHRFCDAQTCFISTLTMRPVGLETAFSIDLADGSPALRGMGIVVEAWPTPGNRFGRPGLLLGVRKLAAASERVFERLLAAHVAATPPPPTALAVVTIMPSPQPSAPLPQSIVAPLPLPSVQADAERTPGSELVLPANPLMNISDHSLEGFVDCTLYEGTGSFFTPDVPPDSNDDPPIDPPVLAPRRVTIPPIAAQVPPPDVVFTAASPLPLSHRTPTPPPQPLTRQFATPPPIPIARPTLTPELAAILGPQPAAPQAIPTAQIYVAPTAPVRMRRGRGPSTWPRRRLAVAGGVAIATIALALVIAGHSTKHAKVASADTPVPMLVAANTPMPRQARPSERLDAVAAPITGNSAIADVPPASVDPSDDAAESSSAPSFGTGPCKLAVSTTPAGSIISVDGEIAGPSPITIGGPCTRRKLEIAHPRYQPAMRIVQATPMPAAVDVTLARPTHDLFVVTSPAGAVVSIDGHRAGTSPTLVKVMGFTTLTLKIEKFGFKPATQRIYSKTPHDRVAIRLGH